MSKIVIKPITQESLQVRRKVVFKDSEDRWIAVSELTAKEKEAFEKYYNEHIKGGTYPFPVAEY